MGLRRFYVPTQAERRARALRPDPHLAMRSDMDALYELSLRAYELTDDAEVRYRAAVTMAWAARRAIQIAGGRKQWSPQRRYWGPRLYDARLWSRMARRSLAAARRRAAEPRCDAEWWLS